MSRLTPLNFVDNEDDNINLGNNVPPAPGRHRGNQSFQLESSNSTPRLRNQRVRHPRLPGMLTIGEVTNNLRQHRLHQEASRFNRVSQLNGFSPDQPVSFIIRVRDTLNIPERYRTPIGQLTPIQQRGPSLGRPSGNRRQSPTTRTPSPTNRRRR